MNIKFRSFGLEILLVVAICTIAAFPQATGKAYSSGENPRPSTAAPQFPSPVTFDDIASTSGVDFRHSASPTSLKYLPETMGAGVALIDFDNDGSPLILRNNGSNNRWLGVVLKGKTSARHGEGARVVVTDDSGGKQIFDAGNSGSYLSSNDPRILVGLGNKTAVKLEIIWPGGKTQVIENPQMNTYIAVNE